MLRLVLAAAVASGLSVAAAALYNAFARPAAERTELIVSPRVTAQAGVAAVGEGDTSLRASATPALDPPFSASLLRPGVEVLSRLDVALDGSPKRLVAVSSRFTATSACEQTFVELFTLQDHRWTRLFDAADASAAGGALLPQPERAGTTCYPQLRVFTGLPAGNRDLLAMGAAYADGSARLLVLGWDAAAAAPTALYDRHSAAGGRIARLGSDDRIELSEDLVAPDGSSGPIGRLSEVVSASAGGVQVVRRIAPNCDRGRLSAGGSAAGAITRDVRTLLLDCSNGSHAAAAITEATVLSPAGVSWAHLRDGDSVQAEYDAASLQPQSAEAAIPVVVSLTDYAANTRRLDAGRQPRPTTTVVRAAVPAAPQRAVPPVAAPAVPPAPALQQPASGGAGPAPTRPPATRAPRSSGPAGVPKPAVTPPPPPRSPPFAGPPPSPPGQ